VGGVELASESMNSPQIEQAGKELRNHRSRRQLTDGIRVIGQSDLGFDRSMD
jgi:hypothetical protein